MKKLLICALAMALLAAAGCHVSDYAVITDDRGGFSGVIRTGHDAYLVPTGQVATTGADGSDEIINLVYQSGFGDQRLSSKNNFDPTASVLFVDQQYCDWRFLDCHLAQSWNPAIGPDDPFDYEGFTDCAGFDSLSLLVDQSASRIGECGDRFWSHQDLAHNQNWADIFANLPTTTWRGEPAYIFSLNAGTMNITLNSDIDVPMLGSSQAFLNNDMQLVMPIGGPQIAMLKYFRGVMQSQGNTMEAVITYNGVETTPFQIHALEGGINARIQNGF